MNPLNDSREFQEVESNFSGRLSYVSSQPAAISSSRSLLSRDKRPPLDTWNTSGLQENVFGNQFSTFGSPGNHPEGIHPARHKENKDQFHKRLVQEPLSQEMKSELRAQFQCRHLQEGRRL